MENVKLAFFFFYVTATKVLANVNKVFWHLEKKKEKKKSQYLEERRGIKQSPVATQTNDEIDAVGYIIITWRHTK